MSFSLMHPLGSARHRTSSGWGIRVHPTLGTETHHNGVDYARPRSSLSDFTGTPVYAAAAGTTKTGSDSTSGNYAKIDHGGGYETAYVHLHSLAVASGQRVEEGTQIGTVGSTGRSTGPHLHFILRINGQDVDPAPYIDRTVSSYIVNYWWLVPIAGALSASAVIAYRRWGPV